MLRKILLGLAPVAAIAAISVSSQTSTAAIGVDEVHVVSQNVQFAKPGAGMGSGIRGNHGLHKDMGGRPTGAMRAIKTSIKGIKTGPVHAAGVS